MWEQQPQAMSKALADHDAVVAKSVKANGGLLLKSRGEGDSTFAIFERPTAIDLSSYKDLLKVVVDDKEASDIKDCRPKHAHI